jgi:FMN-dependent NADH-azoreductase
MARLMHIQASPRGSRSASQAVAARYIESYLTAHPGDTVETLDLWKAELPEFDGAVLDAKYAVVRALPHTPEQRRAWEAVVRVVEHFKAADRYVVSVPMWNFSIPYKLKHYIDLLVQPGLTFSFTPGEGYRGLVTGKPLVIVYARGGAYGRGSGAEGLDQQSAYLRQIFGFIGFTDIREIFVEPTLATATSGDEAVAAARLEAARLAGTPDSKRSAGLEPVASATG